jgi:hypothetical protein
VFTAQPRGTTSRDQAVVVTNQGDRPLRISAVRIVAGDAGSEGEFRTAADGCDAADLQPGDSCRLLVRFAPQGDPGTSRAQLVFETNASGGRRAVALTATSTDEPAGRNGAEGVTGD